MVKRATFRQLKRHQIHQVTAQAIETVLGETVPLDQGNCSRPVVKDADLQSRQTVLCGGVSGASLLRGTARRGTRSHQQEDVRLDLGQFQAYQRGLTEHGVRVEPLLSPRTAAPTTPRTPQETQERHQRLRLWFTLSLLSVIIMLSHCTHYHVCHYSPEEIED